MSHFQIIELDIVDSTNNYAMQLIDADKAPQGLTITARTQTAGKGQRGKEWVDQPGESLLMTVVTAPGRPITDQFLFNSAVAVTIANVLQNLSASWTVRIKWPNDIIVNDKKAGGILIENVLRGAKWSHSVIGIGLNVNQHSFPPGLPYATSLKMESGSEFDLFFIRDKIRAGILDLALNPVANLSMTKYNEYLYKKGQKQLFSEAGSMREFTIMKAGPNGSLEVLADDGTTVYLQHGQLLWEWGK